MTDLEKFINLYKSFGIDLVVEELETVITVELNANEFKKEML